MLTDIYIYSITHLFICTFSFYKFLFPHNALSSGYNYQQLYSILFPHRANNVIWILLHKINVINFFKVTWKNNYKPSWRCMKCYSFSRVQLFVTLWAIAHQSLLSMGFSRQKYWSGLPFLSSTQELNLGLLDCKHMRYHQGNPQTMISSLKQMHWMQWEHRTGDLTSFGGSRKTSLRKMAWLRYEEYWSVIHDG